MAVNGNNMSNYACLYFPPIKLNVGREKDAAYLDVEELTDERPAGLGADVKDEAVVDGQVGEGLGVLVEQQTLVQVALAEGRDRTRRTAGLFQQQAAQRRWPHHAVLGDSI